DLFRRLHAAGVYHNDLKDVNVLVEGPAETMRCVLLDLERVRIMRRLGRRRRVKNLMQLARTLGPQASASDRLRFLAAYLGDAAGWDERRAWARAVGRAAARKDAGRRAVATGPQPRVSCAVIAQDEEAMIEGCLASAAWCGSCGGRRRAGAGQTRTNGPSSAAPCAGWRRRSFTIRTATSPTTCGASTISRRSRPRSAAAGGSAPAGSSSSPSGASCGR